MTKTFLKPAALMLAGLVYAAAALVTNSQTSNSQANKPKPSSDVKIRQRIGAANGQGMETVLYIKGSRMRSEMGGSIGFTSIMQCDLKRTLTINDKTKTYMISGTDNATPSTAAEGDGGGAGNPATPPAATQPRGGVVNVTNTITDTGERKEMFGFTARRIKTSMVKTASPEACDKDQKVESDGWYIDFQYAFECPGQTQKSQAAPIRPRPDCKDEVRTKTIGSARLGFPLLVTTTIYQPDGRTITSTQEVLELSREQLSAALFEAPEGYTLAKNMQELYGMNTSASAPASRPANNAGGSSPATSSSAVSGATAKKAGVIRIGLIVSKVQMSSGDASHAAETLRNGFAKYLTTPNVEVVTLAARHPAQAVDEARQSQCDYVLSASITVKKGGGGSLFGRAIGNIAASAAHIPTGGSTGVIKAKDEATLEYKLEPIDGAKQGVSNTDKAKASRDGDDVITGLVQKAAGVVMTTVSNK